MKQLLLLFALTVGFVVAVGAAYLAMLGGLYASAGALAVVAVGFILAVAEAASHAP